jgi:hypothetical protein
MIVVRSNLGQIFLVSTSFVAVAVAVDVDVDVDAVVVVVAAPAVGGTSFRPMSQVVCD